MAAIKQQFMKWRNEEMPKPEALSYALNKKTDKIQKVHRDKNRLMTLMIPVGAAAGLLWVYFIGNLERYLDGWSLFNIAEKTDNITLIESLLFFALIFFSLLFVFLYAIWYKYNEKFNMLKKEIFEILELNPCSHGYPCDCKDKYCEWLELEEGVDIF